MIQRRGTQIVLLVIAVQILIPVLALLAAPPVRFGFQMFAGYEAEDSLTVRDSSGDDITVDDELWHLPLRPELDWTKRYPMHACAELPAAHDVVMFQHGLGQEVVPCP